MRFFHLRRSKWKVFDIDDASRNISNQKMKINRRKYTYVDISHSDNQRNQKHDDARADQDRFRSNEIS